MVAIVTETHREFHTSEQFMVAIVAKTNRNSDTLSDVMGLAQHQNGVLSQRIGTRYEGTMGTEAMRDVVIAANWLVQILAERIAEEYPFGNRRAHIDICRPLQQNPGIGVRMWTPVRGPRTRTANAH